MTKLKICGVDTLQSNILKFDPDLVVSITIPMLREGTNRYLQDARQYYPMDFDDLDRVSDRGVAPSLDHFRDLKAMILDRFPEGMDRLLVHCQMGISRSTAVSMFVLAVLETRNAPATPEMARRIAAQVFKASPDADPNLRIVSIINHMFEGFGYDLIQAIREHREPKHEPNSGGLRMPAGIKKPSGPRAKRWGGKRMFRP